MATSGWNRSQGGVEVKPQKKPTALRGIIAGVIAILAALVAAFFIFSGSDAENGTVERRRGLIKEVEPAKVAKAEEPKPEPPKKVDPKARPTKVGEIVNNYIKLPSGRIHFIRGEVTNDVALTSHAWYEIFDYGCDNEIACYLTMEPGESLVGTPVYRGRFKKEFLESLKTPIIVKRDDSPEIKELKRSVIEAKADLKAALDRGEDIEKIMLDTRNELQDLGCYKLALEQDMKEMIRSDAKCAEDVDTFVEAANKMLEKKGIAPMKLGPVSRKRLERLVRQTKEE